MQKSDEYNQKIQEGTSQRSDLIEDQRDFNVPIKRLFSAFKSSEAIKAWWWPAKISADQVDIDFREGGSYFISMKIGNESKGGMTGIFQEVKEDEKILMSDSFADENGQAISSAEANLPGKWPEKVFITFEFSAINEQNSRLNFFQDGIPQEMREECAKGWAQMFEKLEKYLYRETPTPPPPHD